jgi:hypothetical protein
MKPMAIWFAVFVIVFGAFGAVYHLIRQGNPGKVFVVIDTSFEMDAVSSRLPGVLDDIDDARYTEFALATDKGMEHSWSPQLTLGPQSFYGPRDLSRITGFPEVTEASELILVTTAGSDETAGFSGWEIVRLE